MRVRATIVALCVTRLASADVYEIQPTDNLYQRLGNLQPGDEVIVHAGTYTTPGLLQFTWAGTVSQPISIHAAPGERPILQGSFAQNTFNVTGSYFTLDGFEIRGGSHGIRLLAVDHATLQNLVLHDLGDVGISCNFSPNNCDALTIRRNEIYDTGKDSGTGEGMYLGCDNGSCVMSNSLVENNYVHDLGGSQGDGIEIKTNSFGNIVRDNVIVRSKYPGIAMYGYAGAGAYNLVERNLVWHTTLDAGIQVVGQVIVRNNIVIDTAGYGIFSKPSNSLNPHDVTIVNNTVVNASICLKTNNWTGQQNQIIANNALYCPNTTAVDINGGAPAAMLANNVALGPSNAVSGFTAGVSIVADLGDPTMSVYPPGGSALVNTGATGQAAIEDFNGTPRDDGLPDVGAYERTGATNPGWMLEEGFKTPVVRGDGNAATGDAGGGNQVPMSEGGCCSAGARPLEGVLALAVFGLVVRPRRRRYGGGQSAGQIK